MAFDPDIDRRNAHLSEPAREAVRNGTRRIVIVGARGWIGRSTLELLREALGSDALARRVVCFGSSAGQIVLDGGSMVAQKPLSDLAALPPEPSLLLHLAFLTKDKVSGMDADAYTRANREFSRTVREALAPIGVDRLFVASSGAAAFAGDAEAAADHRLYGMLKREDEESFADWAEQGPNRRAAIGRIYSLSGPYMNKHETYALASFIGDALAGRPIEVRAPMRVLRSYVAVRELISFVFAQLLAGSAQPVLHFETGGEPLELAEVARGVAQLTDGEVLRRPISNPADNRYVGDDAAWRDHLARFAMTPLTLKEQLAETIAHFARTQSHRTAG